MTDIEDPVKAEAKKREEFDRTNNVTPMSDPGKVHDLLGVADLSKNWPELKPIHDHAMAELEAAKRVAVVELAKRVKAKKEFEEKLVAEREAKAKAEADRRQAEELRREELRRRATPVHVPDEPPRRLDEPVRAVPPVGPAFSPRSVMEDK